MATLNLDDVRNPFEHEIAKGLKALKRATGYKDLEYETEKISYQIEHTYIPDFVVTRKDGSKIYIESKGYWDSIDRRKIRAVKRQHPDLDLRMIFQKNNPISKGSKTRYTDWAGKLGIPTSVGSIPIDWLIA
jgi:predicted nuclease of restriction endonuclease-like RecB superfamily